MDQQLIVAAHDGNVGEVRRLVERERISPNLRDSVARPNYGWTSLHWACKRGHFPVVRYLVEDARADVTVVDNFGWTALHIACRDGAGLMMVKYLVVVGGLSVDTQTHFGNTPLHYACYCGGLETIQYLVDDQQASLDVKNKRGETPLYWAFLGSEDAAARYLLPRTTSVDWQFLAVLWIYNFSWDLKEMVLEKYADGQHQARALARFPVQTILGFPLPKKEAVEDCIKHYPPSTLVHLDYQGRLAIHIALTSLNPDVKCCSVVSLLVAREPKSALARDPETGLFPYETVALFTSEEEEECWLNVVYKLFRADPEPLLRARGRAGSADLATARRNSTKKQKTSH